MPVSNVGSRGRFSRENIQQVSRDAQPNKTEETDEKRGENPVGQFSLEGLKQDRDARNQENKD